MVSLSRKAIDPAKLLAPRMPDATSTPLQKLLQGIDTDMLMAEVDRELADFAHAQKLFIVAESQTRATERIVALEGLTQFLSRTSNNGPEEIVTFRKRTLSLIDQLAHNDEDPLLQDIAREIRKEYRFFWEPA